MRLYELYINWNDFSMHKKITVHKGSHIVYVGTYADMPRYLDFTEVLSYKKYNNRISISIK